MSRGSVGVDRFGFGNVSPLVWGNGQSSEEMTEEPAISGSDAMYGVGAVGSCVMMISLDEGEIFCEAEVGLG